MEALIWVYVAIGAACVYLITVDQWRQIAVIFLGIVAAGGLAGFVWDWWVAGRFPVSW
ncbi:MAG: hypothetical protein AB7G13_30190 [Lautropia sp.]